MNVQTFELVGSLSLIVINFLMKNFTKKVEKSKIKIENMCKLHKYLSLECSR